MAIRPYNTESIKLNTGMLRPLMVQ